MKIKLPAHHKGNYVAIQHTITLHAVGEGGEALPNTELRVIVEHRLFRDANGAIERETWHIPDFQSAFSDYEVTGSQEEIVRQIMEYMSSIHYQRRVSRN